MSPTPLAKNFARLKQVFNEYKITKPEQVFNIDESGFSTRTTSRSRAKAVFDAKGRSNSVELNWATNAQQHVTMMAVVSADGRAWSPLAVLPGKQAKFRKRHDGTRETPSMFLPPTAYCVYREKAGVDTDIFYHWGEKFVVETSLLRKRHRNIILALDGYGAHCYYKVLQLFEDKNIVVVGLPAHTSHRTQPLDFSVFYPYKTAFRNELNKSTIFVKDETKNDVYTICELLTNAYNQEVTFKT
ncbi:hypothetical protein BWQ96_04010 [Gracilariopsis chorda]|uniref:DDE-1 domain-containing protein n=1 Tax=Gracilariopsis chorda TaxID=448386 RepID=A0A2V3IVW9_9FLOR|nr:hypothetical protein BWQ96_04010 [Gracilariopsis chorda]|eukprot:PXF46225.1 hypothetical protein BWQ96_04010 [Gracilariopsis chorda]